MSEVIIPVDVLKKPVFSVLHKRAEQAAAYQAYLALQHFIIHSDRQALDALLEDETLEEILTEEREDLTLGITILAALRALIDKENREAAIAAVTDKQPIKGRRDKKREKRNNTRFQGKRNRSPEASPGGN